MFRVADSPVLTAALGTGMCDKEITVHVFEGCKC